MTQPAPTPQTGVHVRFILGPAGSGKTYRCLAEIRAALQAEPEGLPLVLLAPKQATFQLERQLLADRALPGYTRLHIVSFERLARLVFRQLSRPLPRLLAEEGRVMVLRAILAQGQPHLKLFGASARQPGFADQLSQLLRELQQHQFGPERLRRLLSTPCAPSPQPFALPAEARPVPQLPERVKESPSGSPSQGAAATPGPVAPLEADEHLSAKLHDLACVLEAYQEWLRAHRLHDTDSLLSLAAEALEQASAAPELRLGGLWLDGFAQMTPQERRLVVAVLRRCPRATLAFCLEAEPTANPCWHSPWARVARTYRQCLAEVQALPEAEIEIEVLARQAERGRFSAQPVLAHVERYWAQPRPWSGPVQAGESAVRVVICPNPEAEAVFAAREILRAVREHGLRFRDVAVLVRSLDLYHEPVRRVFSRYEIPFFLDRRESIAHHPLAELTRFALRTVAFGWRLADWLATLKTGLVPATDADIDELETEALARGWQGQAWRQAWHIPDQPELTGRLERLRQAVLPPFEELEQALDKAPTGAQLAAALGRLWDRLAVAQRLADWSQRPAPAAGWRSPAAWHRTAWTQMQQWRDNLALGFGDAALPLRDWLPIVEAGLARLTVGVIPPVLDQVLVGAIDRSRNPDLKRVFVLGVNETVFPAPPPPTGLLTEPERAKLEQLGVELGPDRLAQLSQEQFYGYIACTRARDQLVLTCARHSADGRELNPSIFIEHLRRLVPPLAPEEFTGSAPAPDAQHALELTGAVLHHVAQRARRRLELESGPKSDQGPSDAALATGWDRLASLSVFEPVLAHAQAWSAAGQEQLSPRAVAEAYGSELVASVTALEDFAACPFKFFMRRGLQAEERRQFVIDPRDTGSFAHAVLRAFHLELAKQGKRWRDLEPEAAQALVRDLGQGLLTGYRHGLFAATAQGRFRAEVLMEHLAGLVAQLVQWNRSQYGFDPAQAELEFGPGLTLPGWRLEVGQGQTLVLRGRIDRVDVCRLPQEGKALVVVIDYKSRAQLLDAVKLAHGLELQLLAYLAALEHVAHSGQGLGAAKLQPAGAFYVAFNAGRSPTKVRTEALAEDAQAQREPYQHRGRFDHRWLEQLDTRAEAERGDQFKYRRLKGGGLHQHSDGLESEAFRALLQQVESHLRHIGADIFAGRVAPAPYRKGNETACDGCLFRPVCRFDPWVQPYRVLRKPRHPNSPATVQDES